MDDEIFFLSGRRLERNISFNFLRIFLILIFNLSLTFFIFLYFQTKFKREAVLAIENTKYLTFFYFPPRGNIYDRNGRLLATSEKTYDVYVNLVLATNEEKEIVQKIIKEKNPLAFYWGNELILRFLDLKDVNQILAFKEKYQNIFIIPSYRRIYLGGEELGNLLGYLGLSPESEIQGEFKGLAGLELYYDDYLKGKIGKIVYLKTKEGLRKVYEEEPQRGNDLYLTIDYEYQKEAYFKIKDYFEERNYQKGSFLALDPNSGEVLAFISYPSFDPNIFLKDKSKVQEVLNNKNNPIFNRITNGLYPPGSTIKLIVAGAALEEKIVNPQTLIYSPGEIKIPHPYLPGVYSIFKDNKVHGWTDIYKAISNSVNVYFYVVGGGYPYPNEYFPLKEGLGVKRLINYFRKFNLGEKTGIDFPGEKSGFLPKDINNWKLGDTYNLSIGQGNILVTPLQINLWTSYFAKGEIYKPYLVKKIVSSDGKKIIEEKKPQLIKKNLISQENLNIIRKGMRMTVTQGTAQILNDPQLEIAGKSGSPQVLGKEKLHAIFTGFMPYSKPEIVATLLIEEVPYGSIASLPLYKELMLLWYNLKRTYGGNTF